MKIVIISRYFPPFLGGVSDYVYHLANTMAEHRVQVYIITSKSVTDCYTNIKVFPIVERWNIFAIPGIMRKLREIQPDWVSFQYVPHMYNKYGLPLSIPFLLWCIRKNSYKLVTTFHEVAINWSISPKYWPIAIGERGVAQIICLLSNRVITSIDDYMKMLWATKSHRISIPSNIIPEKVSHLQRLELRKNIASDNSFIVCIFGSILRQNALLLNIVGKLNRQGYNIFLLVIGKLSQRQTKDFIVQVRSFGVDKYVYLTGFVESKEVFRYLLCSDLFCSLDCIKEGGTCNKSSALAAAFAAGLPILGTRGKRTDSRLKHKENIWLIDSLEEIVIYEEIKMLIENSQTRNKLAKKAKETYDQYLNWSFVVQSYLNLLG